MYLPLNHPAMNPIEQVWRAIKQKYRVCGVEKNLANMLDLITSAMTVTGEYADVNSKESIGRRLERTKEIRREVIAHPAGTIPSENSLRKKGRKGAPKPNFNLLPLIVKKKKRNKLELALYFHYLNQTRLKQQRRGEVIDIVFLYFSDSIFLQYLNLNDAPAFNLEKSIADHVLRDRGTELQRSKKLSVADRKKAAKSQGSETSAMEKGSRKTKTKRARVTRTTKDSITGRNG